MKMKRIIISTFLVFAVCFAFNSDAGQQSFRYKKNKPFAGKFKGKLESNSVTYTIKYKISQKGDALSGTVATIANGETVLSLTFTGTVKSNGKVANNLLTMDGVSPSSQGLTPSDYVMVKLRKKGKKGLKMIYTSTEGGSKVGNWVKYKRTK